VRSWFPPPHGQAPNTIEQAFSKAERRTRAARKRNVGDKRRRVGRIAGTFPLDDCANRFGNTGYVP